VLVVDTVIVVVVLEVVENVSVTVESVDVTVDTDVIIEVEVVGDGVLVSEQEWEKGDSLGLG
jgi:hypothetical protein